MISKPLLRVPAAPLQAGHLTLAEETSRYVARVHRCRPGDRILLFDPENAVEAEAELLVVEGKKVVCTVEAPRAGLRCGISGLHLIQGLGKGDKPEQVVRDAVVLGAESIRLVFCERSVALPTERDAAKRERLFRVAVEAARQCGRSNIPLIEYGASFEASLGFGRDLRRVVLHTADGLPSLERVLAASPLPGLVLWVGPEGGFSERELTLLAGVGVTECSLGSLILRTELAAIVALARAGAHLSG